MVKGTCQIQVKKMPSKRGGLKWERPVKTLEIALEKINGGAKTLQFVHRNMDYTSRPSSFSHSELKDHVTNPEIGKDGAIKIAKALESNDKLVALDLSGNKIRGRAITAICKMLKQNKTLRILYLEHNLIDDADCKKFAEVLSRNEVLEELCLSYNNISNKGARAIADALKKNRTLKELWMNGNKIRDGGARALGRALAERRNAVELFAIGENKVRDSGAEHIARAMGKNKNLKTVNIEKNKIGAKSAKYFKRAIKKTKDQDGAQKQWFLGGNRTNDKDMETLLGLAESKHIKMPGSLPPQHRKGGTIERAKAYMEHHVVAPRYWGQGHFDPNAEIKGVL
mmetsp:Transcript_3925/g.4528  ORF Transcript_3925/g.4528 Transcript_3925/m.4528 type:complete len:340 (-) Transcript_3925:492-1511(-)